MSGRVKRMAATALAAVLIGGALTMPSMATASSTSAEIFVAKTGLTSTADTAGGLSESGQLAITDLRTCLASNTVLNVYYLVDSSTSLRTADGGKPGSGSDPDNQRAAILANSLEQLDAVGEDRTVNWAAGFFSDGFETTLGWHELGAGGADELEQAISTRTPRGYTNWPEALSGAQAELAGKQQETPGCQMLVWLTDGAIDIKAPDGMGPEDHDGLNAMCGASIDPAGASPSGEGIFNAFRQSGVVVIGALLATDNAASAAGQFMQPMVEGSGSIDGEPVSCGVSPIPAGYVHGAFVKAASADALSQVFLQLGAQVDGGYPHPFGSDGTFWIDPGVASFRIVVSGDFTLSPPAGSDQVAATATASQEWARVSPESGVTVIDVGTSEEWTHGSWRLEAGETRSLFLFSGLSIAFEEKNEIERTPDGASGTVVAHVRSHDGIEAGLSDYSAAELSASLVQSDGTLRDLPDAEVDRRTGRIEIPIPADITEAEVVVQATIDPLTTSANDLELAPITTQDRITTVLPENFPRLATAPVRLSTLEGKNGQAEGKIQFAGPVKGGSGSVCLAPEPTIESDAATRADTWTWRLDDKVDSDGCIEVAQGQTVEVSLAAKNSAAADSTVKASIPVVMRSASGEELPQDVPIVFQSTHPVNSGEVLLFALGLLLLGILLPLLGLWIVNWWTTRLDLDPQIQRASFPVRIAPSGVTFIGAPDSDTALSERFRYGIGQGDDRSLADPELGRIRTVLPWFPLRAPKYAIGPTDGRMIVAARTQARVASAGERASDGSVRFSQLPFASFWAISVPRAELIGAQARDELTGTAVIYHRFDPASPGQYRERLAEIAQDSTVSGFADRLRAAVVAEEAARTSKSTRKASKASTPAPRSAPTPTGAPPRPGSSVPPRPNSAPAAPPRSPGAAPERPTPGGANPANPASPSAPPPRPGSVPPPPRPGSTPPPRG